MATSPLAVTEPTTAGSDELAIFAEALSEDEIKDIADRGLGFVVLDVDPTGKLATTWGGLKGRI